MFAFFYFTKRKGRSGEGLVFADLSLSSFYVPILFDFLNLFKAVDIFAQHLISDEMPRCYKIL